MANKYIDKLAEILWEQSLDGCYDDITSADMIGCYILFDGFNENQPCYLNVGLPDKCIGAICFESAETGFVSVQTFIEGQETNFERTWNKCREYCEGTEESA